MAEVHVGGLALDYCVKATALDARRAGFDVVLHRDATRAVEVQAGDGDRALAELRPPGSGLSTDGASRGHGSRPRPSAPRGSALPDQVLAGSTTWMWSSKKTSPSSVR